MNPDPLTAGIRYYLWHRNPKPTLDGQPQHRNLTFNPKTAGKRNDNIVLIAANLILGVVAYPMGHHPRHLADTEKTLGIACFPNQDHDETSILREAHKAAWMFIHDQTSLGRQDPSLLIEGKHERARGYIEFQGHLTDTQLAEIKQHWLAACGLPDDQMRRQT